MSFGKRSLAYHRLWGSLLLVATACSGTVPDSDDDRDDNGDGEQGAGGNGGGSGQGGGSVETNMPPPVIVDTGDGKTCAVKPGPAPLRRLTNLEYRHTVDDLFPAVKPSALANGLVGDNVRNFFDNNALSQAVLRSEAEAFTLSAEAVSGEVAKKMKDVTGCSGTLNDACAKTYLEKLAFRAFRRPLEGGEKTAILAVYDKARERLEPEDATRAGIEFILQTPQFLYRPEAPLGGGDAEQGVALSSWDVASRLSYFLWASMPDDELFGAAEKGELVTRDQVKAQARRLLASPRALDSMHHFFAQWMLYKKIVKEDVSKNVDFFPNYNATIAADLVRESEALIDRVIKGELDYRDLFSGAYSFRNSRLEGFYKGKAEGGDGAFNRVDLPSDRSAGFLTHGSILAAMSTADDSSPIFRGHFVRTHLLCDPLKLPPGVEVPPLPPIAADATVRTVHELHMEVEPCKSCHLQMDPIGFALENYDATGVWRDKYANGASIDTSGEIYSFDKENPKDSDGQVNGPRQLGERLAASSHVRECMARQLLEFAVGRDYDETIDSCTVGYLSKTLADADGHFDEMVVSLVTSDTFMRTQKAE